jgi:ubiquitin carboxyl-terminal hydrolase 9/24
MDTGDSSSPGLSHDFYDYNLVGVLVHAGVAQGGHYYSLRKDRSTGSNDESVRWYKFDDEDVTMFGQSAIETECFGGKIKMKRSGLTEPFKL